jgi:hypothetical protein
MKIFDIIKTFLIYVKKMKRERKERERKRIDEIKGRKKIL